MLDYTQQRDQLNRSCSTDRRRGERRSDERRSDARRQPERRAIGGHRTVAIDHERRREDRRQLPRRAGERRAAERRALERRRDPARVQRFPRPGGGFLTPEERDFLQSTLRQSSDD